MSERNFISAFRGIPLWPDNLVPLDEIVKRLAALLGLDTTSFDPLTLLGGILGFRDLRIHRVDGVSTVTGEFVVATEIVLSPFQSYVGLVLGDPNGATTSFPFALRLRDEPPIRNGDDTFEIDENALDPQLGAFTPVERNPETGLFDVASWRLSLRNIPAKIRLLKGVTRVEPIDPNNLTRGFRDLPNAFVDVGIDISLDFDSEGTLDLWPPDPSFQGAAGDPASAIDMDLGWFRVASSPLIIAASGLGFHRANTRFPDNFNAPAGLDPSWHGFIAKTIGGFWWKVPKDPEDEVHIYGIDCEDLLVGNDVLSFHGSFQHGGGPHDPFESLVPVPVADLPESRWSIRRIEVWVTEGVGDFLQFGGQLVVAAILDVFNRLPIRFEVSLGRVLKEVEGFDGLLPFVELQGALAPVQNNTQPAPDGKLNVPIFNWEPWRLDFEINSVRFGLLFPGGDVPGVDLPTVIEILMNLTIKIGEAPAFEIGSPGVGCRYTTKIGKFEWLFQGLWLDTKLEVFPLKIRGYEFSISRIGLGSDAGALDAYWIAFDAHLNFPDALGRAEVYGMRLGWDDDGVLFSIEGIGVAVKKPAVEFVGILKFFDGPPSFTPEGEEPLTIQPGSISGLVRMAFPALDTPFAFDVGLTHGKYTLDANPADTHSFWMLLVELIFPGGVPIGLGDLTLYGATLAVGNNVAPRKAPATPWFDWYSKELPTYSIVAPTKWIASHDRFAFGLGGIFGSAIRSGYPHNERILGMRISGAGDQDATWIFEGQARFLKEVTAPGKPQIAILLVIAPDQVLLRAEFHFSFPTESDAAAGLVMTARGMIEAVSDQTGAGHHHIYLGRNQPYSERINASVLLGFFTARSFYMLDWADLQLTTVTLPPVAFAFGFAQGWNWNKKYGPLRLYLEANVELEVGFSFNSALYGFLRVYGGVGLKIWGFGFGLSIDAAFTFFTSDGWELTGELKIKLNLPWPIPDYKKTLDLDFGPGASPPGVMRSPLLQLALSSPSLSGDAPLHEWTESNVLVVPGDFNSDRSLLPVDGSIVLAFRVPAANKVPWISGVDVLPVDGSGEWRFRYSVVDLIVERRAPGSPTFEALPDGMKYGFWEILSTAPASSSAPVTGPAPVSQVMRIWGDLPGQQLRNLGNLEHSGSITWLDGFLDLFATWPCGPDVVKEPTCVHYDLVSFRVLDAAYTRITLLSAGTPIRSRPVVNPDTVPPGSTNFATLDQVVANPRPDVWNEHKKTLALPYLYISNPDRQAGYLPILSGLEIDLPAATEAVVTLLGVFPGELFAVQAFHGATEIATANASGDGLHVITLVAPDLHTAINRLRISTFNNYRQSATDDPAAVSVVASVCYRTVDQAVLQDHMFDQHQSLDQLLEIVDVPPGSPGDNAGHFHLHAQGTQYRLTPVVTCERKGPEADWEVVHDHLPLAPALVTAGPPPADLTPYLGETIPAVEQDPVYLGDDMQLRFNRSYGPEMYAVSGFDFRVDVLDSQRQPVPVQLEWHFSEEPAFTPEQELLIEALLSSPCMTADITAVRKKLELIVRPVLAPRTRYALVIRSNAHADQSLFEVPFSTSRYRSFDEQYAELEQNQFQEMLPRAMDSTLIAGLLAQLPFPTREAENVALEAAWEQALGLNHRERPNRGEVVVFYRPADDGLAPPCAILIDSPEPLLVDRRTQLDVVAPAGASIHALRSMDGARTLLFAMDAGVIVDLPVGDFTLTTTYLREVEGLPTQRIAGDSSPSSVSLVLTVTADIPFPVDAL